jgi:DNA-binding NarL/FixJ family response regulator
VTISINHVAVPPRRVVLGRSQQLFRPSPPLVIEKQRVLHRSLREEAVAIDPSAGSQVALAVLWKELSLGLSRVVDGFFTEARCLLLTTPNREPTSPVQGRRLQILEDVLTGVGQKRIAMDLGLAPSTVALNARLALEMIGVCSRPSRAHPLLMLAARASQHREAGIAGSLSFLNHGGVPLKLISVPRPDLPLKGVLPPAELSVVRSLIEGERYEEIAQRRGTSTRTIANQITAVFRRMKVSGRNELLIRLFTDTSPTALRACEPAAS